MTKADIDESITEFSILRLLGFKKSNIIVILIFKGFTYAIPGFLIGNIYKK